MIGPVDRLFTFIFSVEESIQRVEPDLGFVRDEGTVDDRLGPEHAFQTTESTRKHNSNRHSRTGEPTRINGTSCMRRRSDYDYGPDECDGRENELQYIWLLNLLHCEVTDNLNSYLMHAYLMARDQHDNSTSTTVRFHPCSTTCWSTITLS